MRAAVLATGVVQLVNLRPFLELGALADCKTTVRGCVMLFLFLFFRRRFRISNAAFRSERGSAAFAKWRVLRGFADLHC